MTQLNNRTVRAPIGGGSVDVLDNVDVTYATLPLKSVRIVKLEADEVTNGRRRGRRSPTAGLRLELPSGAKLKLSNRFWPSFSRLFGLTTSVFDYFTHEEVFGRITEKMNPGDSVRFAIDGLNNPDRQSSKHFNGTALALSSRDVPVLPVAKAKEVISRFGGNRIVYQDGEIGAHFVSPFSRKFTIVGKTDSEFETGYFMNMPVDGFSTPEAFLELIRQVCSNGAVAMTHAFRTGISLGKDDIDLGQVLDRIMCSFNSDEGYSALSDRFSIAAKSWASLHNFNTLHKRLIDAIHLDGQRVSKQPNGFDIPTQLDVMAGNPLSRYGLASSSEVSAKQARLLPISTTVYDLINFATEVATHKLNSLHARNKVYGWVGDLVVEEYDLENTVENCPEFKDIFLTHGAGGRPRAAR